MQRKRRDNRTRMQRKEDMRNTIAAFCLFACAVLAFCAVVCKITTAKLKSQEGALKRETAAQRISRKSNVCYHD